MVPKHPVKERVGILLKLWLKIFGKDRKTTWFKRGPPSHTSAPRDPYILQKSICWELKKTIATFSPGAALIHSSSAPLAVCGCLKESTKTDKCF